MTSAEQCFLRLFRLISSGSGFFTMKMLDKYRDKDNNSYSVMAKSLIRQGKLKQKGDRIYVSD